MDKQAVSNQNQNEEGQTNNQIDKQTQYQDNQQNHNEQNGFVSGYTDNAFAQKPEKQLFPHIKKKNQNQHTSKYQKQAMKQTEKLPFLKQVQKQKQTQTIHAPKNMNGQKELNLSKQQRKQLNLSEQQIIQGGQEQVQKPVKNNHEQGQGQKTKDCNMIANNEKQEENQPIQQKKVMDTEPQKILCFDPSSKSHTIFIEDTQNKSACQGSAYYQNSKLILTKPIKSLTASCRFRIENIKYCIGFGVALKQVVVRHNYTYESEGANQLSHGLYIVTSQGYSWSHSEKEEDDILRAGFNQMYNGLLVDVSAIGEQIQFKWKKGSFKLALPARIREKYTVCFCAYLHQKSDAVSIAQ